MERLRELKQREASRETLAKASGISNPAILDKLLDLGIRPEIVGALAVIPLVEVAWADGTLDGRETAGHPRPRREIRDRPRLHRSRSAAELARAQA